MTIVVRVGDEPGAWWVAGGRSVAVEHLFASLL